jgi:hypothetical protein
LDILILVMANGSRPSFFVIAAGAALSGSCVIPIRDHIARRSTVPKSALNRPAGPIARDGLSRHLIGGPQWMPEQASLDKFREIHPMEGSGAERLFTWNDDLLGV